ncbi:hypothetical protein [Streptomyces sp. NPDC126499]|uniref:hypothetical protein n=1 Tax=Streptomyces sp. NPDC126499 TaxID=3155314 RepID=UPI00332D717A
MPLRSEGPPASDPSDPSDPSDASDLLDEVENVLLRGGFEQGCGLTARAHAYGVVVSWRVDPLVKPVIIAHVDDPDVEARAGLTGLRVAMETALVGLFHDAGLRTAAHPDGFVLVTRRGA